MSGWDNVSFTMRTFAGTTDTLTNNDSVVVYTNTAAKTVNLPSVSTVQPGRRFVVINTATGAATVTPFSGQTINGSATLAVTASTGRADFLTDGVTWWTVTAS